TVVRGAVVEGLLACLADVPGRVEIGLADLEVDDLSSLPLQGLGAGQHLERGFGPQTRHALGEVHGGADYTRRHGARGSRRGLVLEGRERGTPGRAPPTSRLDRRFRDRAEPRHQSGVRALPRGAGRTAPAVVERSALRRSASARGGGQLVRGGALLRMAVDGGPRAAPPAYRSGVGKSRA